MNRSAPAWNWQKLAALCLGLCLLVLVLLHPASPHAPLLAAIVLVPVALFALVAVPRSLWPAADCDPLIPVPLRARAQLFQRPPPQSLR